MKAHDRVRSAALIGAGAALALLSSAVPAPLAAQDTDPRWLPWLGCWESAGGSAEMLTLCVRPSTPGPGVEVLEVADGEVRASETVVADGVRRESAREGCTGWEEARFSDDGRRVYVTSEHVCEGGVRRTSSGILVLSSPSEWLDVRSLDVEGRPTAWVQRYALAGPGAAAEAGLADPTAGRTMAVDAARMAAAAPVDIDAVIDASLQVHPEAVKAWIVELDEPLRADARRLVRMADRGVPPEVIDVVVAHSYPGRFALENGATVDRDDAHADAYGWDDPYGRRRVFGGLGWSPFYSPYGLGVGYGGFGYYDFYGYRPTIVVVQPRRFSSGVTRLVKGLGYTGRGGSGGGTAGGTAGGAPTASGGGDRGGSGAVGGGGGGSTSSTGRKAKPRGGGGGSGG